jgi:O-antigen ligase
MVLKTGTIFSIAGFFLLILGLHGHFTGEQGYYTSENMFLHADKNKYGFIIAFIFPFLLLSFSMSSSLWKKIFWGLCSIWLIIASVLSASRGAIGNVLAVMLVWALFMLKKSHLKVVVVLILLAATAVTFTFNSWPEPVKEQIVRTKKDIWTFNFRTTFFWKPALQSVAKKPLTGWGGGKEVYRDPRPFEGIGKPNWELKGGLHNEFISILFHQGALGLASYLMLLFSSLYILMSVIRKESGERRYIAIALLSVIIGSFFLNSFVKIIPFRPLALVLGMSAALMYNGKPEEASHV